MAYLRTLGHPDRVYTTALQTMVFCAAEPDKDAPLIRRNVDWLQSVQLTSGDRKGAWSYSAGPGRGRGDNSNTQFALLALHEAERAGVAVRPQVWQIADQYSFGRALLVAPVLEPGVNERRRYLPVGQWVDFWDGTKVPGDVWLTVPAALDRIPVFRRLDQPWIRS